MAQLPTFGHNSLLRTALGELHPRLIPHQTRIDVFVSDGERTQLQRIQRPSNYHLQVPGLRIRNGLGGTLTWELFRRRRQLLWSFTEEAVLFGFDFRRAL